MPKLSIQSTPNPNSLKFTAEGAAFLEGGMESFGSPAEAEGHPLGESLFAVPGVANVFILPQFLTISKEPEGDWDEMLPPIEELLESYLADHPTG